MRILFVANDVAYFLNHRLSFALDLLAQGHQVHVAAPEAAGRAEVERRGLHFHPLRLRRGIADPWREWLALWDLWRLVRVQRPELLHAIVLKAALLGGLVARVTRIPAFVATVPGLGVLFVRSDPRTRLIRGVVAWGLRCALGHRNARVIFETADDRATLISWGAVSAERAVVIRGVGVPIDTFRVSPEPPGVPVVLFASRMLWEKGVGEFVAAARICKARGVAVRFVLAGGPDPGNPGTVTESQLRAWAESGVVEWLGVQDDMPAVHAASHIGCLATYYGEGIPRVLMEAAASGRALVATDWPGCREIVRAEENGILVPPRDPEALADAVQRLAEHPQLRRRMGARAREIAVAEFDVRIVNAATTALYAELTSGDPTL